MKFICIAAMALICFSCNRKITAQTFVSNQPVYTDQRGAPMLLGIHKKEDLQQLPYKDWFNKNYDDYKIDSTAATELKPFLRNMHFEIFMGTWCGDSRREVPRMFKILEYAGVLPSQIKLVMVDNHDSTYKQSPAHEEKGKGIFRVPDLLLYNGKKEINRVVESPVISLEKDMMAIVKENNYQPNYKGATYLSNLSTKTKTTELIKDSLHLREILKTLVTGSSELNSLGYVWMAAGEKDKAMVAFQLNASLFPDDTNVYDSLGEINLKLNNKEAAKKYYQRVLQMQPGSEHAKKILEQL